MPRAMLYGGAVKALTNRCRRLAVWIHLRESAGTRLAL